MTEKELKAIRAALWYESRKRAKERGLEHTIKKEDIDVPTHCPILGVPLAKNKKVFGRDSYTLDRINSDFGYIKGNVRVISWQANYVKSNLTLEQAENLLKYMRGEI